MVLKPTLAELDRLDDPFEREYVDARRGSLPDEELIENLYQYRNIQQADAAEEETPPAAHQVPPDARAETSGTPSLEEFLAVAREDNPGVDERDLKRYWNAEYGKIDPATLPSLEEFLPAAKADNPGVKDHQLKQYWKDNYEVFGAALKKPPERDFMRGMETAVKQIPQLAYGVEAGIGAAGETVFGEGGISTAIKEHGVKKYTEASEAMAKEARPTDQFSTAWEQAKAGNVGALVDFLQYGLGYATAQGVEMLATGGMGYAVGKLGLQGAAKLTAEKLITKEASRLAAQGVTKDLIQQATKNVAGRIGQTVALAATATGMEGGEIYGDLVTQATKEGRELTGEELSKAFGATVAAGALEFVGDKIGFDLMVGKSPLGKLAAGAPGLGGRAARGAIQGLGGAVGEGATEFGQTMLEQVGKGQEVLTPEAIREAVDSAALGVVGGTAIGVGSGVLTGPQAAPTRPPQAVPAPVEAIPAQVGVGDPTVGVDQAIQESAKIIAEAEDEEAAIQARLDAEELSRQVRAEIEGATAPARTKGQPSDIPVLEGQDATPAPTITPGTAFTPRQPVEDPQAAIRAERERLLAMRGGVRGTPEATVEEVPITDRRRPLPAEFVPSAVPTAPAAPPPTIQEPIIGTRQEGSEVPPPAPPAQPAAEPVPGVVEPTTASVMALAKTKGFDPASPVFQAYTKMVTGKPTLEELSPADLRKLHEKLTRIKEAQTLPKPKEETGPPKPPPAPMPPGGYVPVYQERVADAQAATIPRHELVPEQNAEMLGRAMKAEADLASAGTERGGRYFAETQGQGSTPEITGLKSPTAAWYKQATTGPGKLSRQRVEIAVQKIVQDQGRDTGKDVQRIKELLMLDKEFRGTPYYPKSPEQWNALIAEATGRPQEPTGEPFQLQAQEAPKAKSKAAQPEQQEIPVAPPTVGEAPIIGREAQPEEAPLFSEAAKEPEAEQTALPEEGGTAPSVEDLHALADQQGIPWDNDEAFMDLTERTTGKRHLDALTPEERTAMAAAIRAQPKAAPQPTQILAKALRSAADEIEGKPKPEAKPKPKEKSKETDTGTALFARRMPDQTQTQAFKNWFGDSKVVDDDGKPLVVYHGTPYKFDTFDIEKTEGAHFGSREQAGNVRGKGKLKVGGYYLSIKNPLRVPDLGVWKFNGVHSYLSVNDIITDAEADEAWDAWQRKDEDGWNTLKAILGRHDYDGFVYENEQEGEGDSYVAFHPTQIKSATGNVGTFDPDNPSILFARRDTGQPEGEAPPPRDAPDPETARKILEFNQAVEREQGIPHAYAWSPDEDTDLANAFRKVFGVDIVPVRLNNPQADVFASAQYRDTLFLRTDEGNQYGFLRAAGHELLHQIRKDNPDLYQWFARRATAYLTEGAEGRYRERLLATGTQTHGHDVFEEMLADFTGDALAEPQFLASLAADSPSKFRAFLHTVLGWLQRVAEKLRLTGFGSSQYFDDVAELRGYLRQVLDAYAKGDTDFEDLDRPAFARRGNAPTFFSQVERTLEEKMPARASFEQIRNILKQGVKEEELKWLGLDDYLKSKDFHTKADVLDFVRQNNVQVQEVMKGEQKKPTFDQWYRELPDRPTKTTAGLRSGERENWEMRYSDAMQQLTPNTKFASYQLPGGSDYRELLLTLPDKADQFDPAKVRIERNTSSTTQGTTTIYYDGEEVSTYGDDPKLQPDGSYKQKSEAHWMGIAKSLFEQGDAINKIKPKSQAFRGGHWDTPNVLAHVRFNTREVDGKKVLFLEELQSDWHQKGRKQGYGGKIHWQLTDRGMFVGNFPTEAEAKARQEEIVSDRRYIQEDRRFKIEQVREEGIPDAPFKKTWHELALKRMLRFAAENGYDQLAWTPGSVQAERYDLSKQVGGIGYQKREEGYKILYRPRDIADGPTAWRPLTETLYAENQLEDVVGKDLAKKIVAGEGLERNLYGRSTRFFDAPDLKVGGEGMKGFYDTILPTFLNKYGKKWGATVEPLTMNAALKPVTGETWEYQGRRFFDREEDGHTYMVDHTGELLAAPTMKGGRKYDREAITPVDDFAERLTQAEKDRIYAIIEGNESPSRMPKEKQPVSVHALPITQAMKDSVLMEGQPLFKRREAPLTSIDDLPAAVQADIIENLMDHVPALKDLDYQSVKDNLIGLVDGPRLRVGYADPQRLNKAFGPNRTSDVAVENYREALRGGADFPAVLVNHGEFFDGGHRVRAYAQEGKRRISVVDIGPLLEMDWERWLEGDETYQPFGSKETPLFKRKLSRHQHLGTLSDEQTEALEHVHGTPQTWAQQIGRFRTDWKRQLSQGLVDQFAPILDYTKKGYILSRLSKGGDGTLEALLMYGKPYVDDDGAYRVDYKQAEGFNGFAKVLSALQGEQDRFLEWVAALRASRLKEVGLENLYSADDIKTLKTLNQGEMKDGKSRAPVYEKALMQLNEWNNAMIDIPLKSGLITKEYADTLRDLPFVPFYRQHQELGVLGFGSTPGLVKQYAWKKLKGGTEHLNDDLLANLLQNWSHLITASAKNRAAKETLDAAKAAGVATEVEDAGKGTVYVMDEGTPRHFTVSDPLLMDAIGSLHYAGLGAIAKPFTAMKKALTFGVTVNPAYKIRNLIRDSVQAMATADLSYNPFTNIAAGAKATQKGSETRAQMLAGGGMIRFGTMLDGTNADRTRRLIEQGVDKDLILDDAGKVERFWKRYVMPAFDAYQEFGDRGEQVNRAALYQRMLDKGMSHLEASFWARDLMDFSLHGKWEAVRILTQVVPFMNARLQGLYKLGRAYQEDYKRMNIVAGSVILASVALMLAYKDDDDWKKRDDWDIDNYAWFKIGNMAVRMPMPFEIGAIGTVAMRAAQYFIDDEMTGERFAKRLGAIVSSQLSMNPTPQLIKPLIDLYANRDAFTQKPIETFGMERLQKKDRMTDRTSQVARFLGSLGLPDPAKLAMGTYDTLSPVQIDALLHGYFSWAGTAAVTAIDYGIRPIVTKGEKPAMTLRDAFLAGNFVENLPAASSRYVTQMYEQAAEIEQAYGSYRDALKKGDIDKARALLAEERDKLMKYPMVEKVKRTEADLNAKIRQIEQNADLSAEEKRSRIDALKEQKHLLARRLSERVAVAP